MDEREREREGMPLYSLPSCSCEHWTAVRANAPTTSRRKEKDTVESMYLLDELLGSTTTSSSTTRECVCPQQDKREREIALFKSTKAIQGRARRQ